MYKIANVNFTSTKYVCVNGQLLNSDNSVDLTSALKHFFMKIDAGYYLSTPRQFISEFDEYIEIEKEFEKKVIGEELEELKSLKLSLGQTPVIFNKKV